MRSQRLGNNQIHILDRDIFYAVFVRISFLRYERDSRRPPMRKLGYAFLQVDAPESDSLFEPCAIFARTQVVSALPPQRPVSPRRCRIKPTNEAVTTEAFSLVRSALPSGGFPLGRRVTVEYTSAKTP